MPTRMGNRTKHKRIWVVIGILLPIILVIGGLVYAYSGTDDAGDHQQTSASQVSSKTSSKKTRSTSTSSSATSSSSSSTQPDLTGLGFQIMPVLFNGEGVDQAMAENKAPQNTVHDGVMLGYFINQTQARVSGLARYMYAHTIGYSVNGQVLAMNGWQIPLTVTDGQLQTVQWQAQDSQGNTLTWKLDALDDAQTEVDGHANPDEVASSVDVHNLTTAQMEHWVRTYLQSTVSTYNASDYTFTQKFVDGYAEVYQYTDQQLTRVFRVDAQGNLQVRNPADSHWQMASDTYQ
ncbi:hypothetical protein [Lacticaseibacillus porcinae]|uniref:hypothetical protein n=1 Tax=Lacticaseibacillus porcinae TaxID=1123687 RepID=UPI000F771452|nr:hypothetical protein [Lacticaseibacillus porcinae]